MDQQPGRDMPFDYSEYTLSSSTEKESVPTCSIILLQPKSPSTLQRELRLFQTQNSSLQLYSVKVIRLRLASVSNTHTSIYQESLSQDSESEQIRSRLLLPATSDIQPLDWDTHFHRSTHYLVKLPTAEQWNWSDHNIQVSGSRLVTALNIHALGTIDHHQYPNEFLKQIERIEQSRQLSVIRWSLALLELTPGSVSVETDNDWRDFRDAILDERPLAETTHHYQQLLKQYGVTDEQFLHAIRLVTIEDELLALELNATSDFQKQLGMVAALPDLTSDDIRWIAPLFPELQQYLTRMGIATKTRKIKPAQGFLTDEFGPAPAITTVLNWKFPDQRAQADTMLRERFKIDDFSSARDQYQAFTEHLIARIGEIFDLGGLADHFNADALQVDTELAQPSLDQVTFVHKIIGVYETSDHAAATPAHQQQADTKRFEARRMASCLEYIANLLKRQKEYRAFEPTVQQLMMSLGYDSRIESQKPLGEQGKILLNLSERTAGDTQAIRVPVRVHFREEKSSETWVEKMLRDGYPNDLTKDTDFFASTFEILLSMDDPLLKRVTAPDSLTFWTLDTKGKLTESILSEPLTDHAVVFQTMQSVISQLKRLLVKERPEIHIVKYKPTGTFRGRSKGSQAEDFSGLGRFVIHTKTTPTWAYQKERQFMLEIQLIVPTKDCTAPEAYELKRKDEQRKQRLTYQLRRIEKLALLFFPPRFYPQMRLLERAYGQARTRLT